MPSLLRRMQPWLASLPSDEGSPVPWMPTVPSPPPNVVYTSEWADVPKAYGPYAEYWKEGTVNASVTKYSPGGVGEAAVPTPTGSLCTTAAPFHTVMRWAASSMRIRQ